MRSITGVSQVAGVVGAPIAQSLSPLIHNAWLQNAGVDGVYVPFALPPQGFERFVEGVRGGPLRGLNVTLPFKGRALALADTADRASLAAGAANLLLFQPDGAIEARNTDGTGLIVALTEQAPTLKLLGAVVVVIGAGGAACGAVPALLHAGVAEIRVVNRTLARAEALADRFGAPVRGLPLDQARSAFDDVNLIVNASSAGLDGQDPLELPLEAAPRGAVVMDMVYKPLLTPLLRRAQARDLSIVDGLAMLIGQAAPSYEAMFGLAPPLAVNVRALALQALGEGP